MMKTYIILLRAVTPTGKNKVPMAQLRNVLAMAGFSNVRTYIQSGNALVDTDLSAIETANRVHNLIKEHIGPDLVVVVRTGAELQKVLLNNPFEATTFHEYFLLVCSNTHNRKSTGTSRSGL